MKTFIFGEAMLEYHSHGGSGLRYGGDALNTAIHRALRACDVADVTTEGTDPIGDALVDAWESEGIDRSCGIARPGSAPAPVAHGTLRLVPLFGAPRPKISDHCGTALADNGQPDRQHLGQVRNGHLDS